jgi:hypothetical protein
MSMTPQASVDFGAGSPIIAQWFRSALFALQVDDRGEDFTVPAAELCAWLQGYDAWYREISGICEGRGLEHLYHRTVEIIGADLLLLDDKLAQIATICRELGYGFAATFPITECLTRQNAFDRLISCGHLYQVGLHQADVEMQSVDGSAVRKLVEGVLERGVKLGLLGSIAYFTSIGLLNSSVMNRSDVTMYPLGIRTIGALPNPKNPVRPCFARFRVYVDCEGMVYPCLGLMGIQSCRLGAIREPWENSVFAGRSTSLNLHELATKGPEITASRLGGNSELVFPSICEHHRSFLLAMESEDGGSIIDEP